MKKIELIEHLKQNIGCKMQREVSNGFTGTLLEVKENGDMRISCSDWWESVYDHNPYMPVELTCLALDATKIKEYEK